jgi:putative ABC transport system permease protein
LVACGQTGVAVMLGMVWRQATTRLGRTVALAMGIVVAATGFTVLTASAQASQLQTRGTVEANSTTVYDILVRPTGTQSELEKSQGLVQSGFLTGIYGGITVE